MAARLLTEGDGDDQYADALTRDVLSENKRALPCGCVLVETALIRNLILLEPRGSRLCVGHADTLTRTFKNWVELRPTGPTAILQEDFDGAWQLTYHHTQAACWSPFGDAAVVTESGHMVYADGSCRTWNGALDHVVSRLQAEIQAVEDKSFLDLLDTVAGETTSK